MTATLRRLLGGLFGSTFGGAVLVTLVLAGWALWSGGVLDGPIARQVRASSVYIAPGSTWIGPPPSGSSATAGWSSC